MSLDKKIKQVFLTAVTITAIGLIGILPVKKDYLDSIDGVVSQVSHNSEFLRDNYSEELDIHKNDTFVAFTYQGQEYAIFVVPYSNLFDSELENLKEGDGLEQTLVKYSTLIELGLRSIFGDIVKGLYPTDIEYRIDKYRDILPEVKTYSI